MIAAGPRLRLLRHAYGFRLGSVEEQPGVVSARGPRITITLPAAADFNIDGELVAGLGPELALTVRPGAVELIVPG